MINYDSILSAFDGKPTLLQWLKLVKKALDESVLKDITLKQDGANVVFTFNFEDGTSISTPAVTLPKGDTGAKGDKGDKGEQGVSVTGVDEVSNEVVGSQTLTTLRFNFSNSTNNEVVVHAENGKNGGKLYRHDVTMFNTSSGYLHCTIINNTNTEFTASDLNDSFFKKVISASADVISMHKTYMVKLITVTSTGISAIYYASYPFSDTASLSFSQNDSFTDTVTEL